jgi:hypothetical protein
MLLAFPAPSILRLPLQEFLADTASNLPCGLAAARCCPQQLPPLLKDALIGPQLCRVTRKTTIVVALHETPNFGFRNTTIFFLRLLATYFVFLEERKPDTRVANRSIIAHFSHSCYGVCLLREQTAASFPRRKLYLLFVNRNNLIFALTIELPSLYLPRNCLGSEPLGNSNYHCCDLLMTATYA